MPLTLSHPAVVLPLARLGLPMSALAAGSVVPDLPLFAGLWSGYGLSHSVVGVVTLDVALALLLVLGWDRLVRDAVADLGPDRCRARHSEGRRLSRAEWALTPLAACAGAATHVLWDSFTHAGRWGARQVGWLEQEHAGATGAAWLQYGSSVVGLAVVCTAVVAHVRRLPRRPAPPRVLPRLALPVTVLVAGAAGVGLGVLREPGDAGSRLFHVAVDVLTCAGLAVAALSVVWWLARRHGPPTR